MSKKSPLSYLTVLFVVATIILAACTPPAATPQMVEVTKVVAGTPVVEQVVVTATPLPEPTVGPKPTGKITVWMWSSAHQTIENSSVLADFQKEYPDIEVEFVESSATDTYTELLLAISGGTGLPDVVAIENSHLAQFVDLGGLTDLTDRLAPYMDKMNQYKWHDAQKDGRYYAMPWDSGPVVLYYRRDVFEAAGLPTDPEEVSNTIVTWDDYLEACKTIKEKTTADCFSLNKANNFGRLYEMMLWQQGLGYYNSAGEVTVDSPENLATLKKMTAFWDAGVVSDQQEWTDGWYTELGSNEEPIATIVEASWMGVFLKTFIASGTAGKWGVALMPVVEAGQVRAANDGGSNLVIPEGAENKEAAWAFIEFVLGREQSQLKMFAYSDFIPSLETTYDDALFIEPDTFFGGQVARQVYAEVVTQIPQGYVYGPYYNEMNTFVSQAIQKVATGQMTPEEALKEAADAIRLQTGMN